MIPPDKNIKVSHRVDGKKIKDHLYNLPENYTCHEVCQSVLMNCLLMNIYTYKRGWFIDQKHSWLDDEHNQVIIDPYPIAAADLIIVYYGGMSPWRRLYIVNAVENNQ